MIRKIRYNRTQRYFDIINIMTVDNLKSTTQIVFSHYNSLF
jgi:hypothetical protein